MESVPEICQYPSPILTTPCAEVTKFDEGLGQLIELMFCTMYFDSGIGLAANQIFQSVRVAVMHVPGWPRMTLMNPKIVKSASEKREYEGCLSFEFGCRKLPVTRAWKVWVEYQDRTGAHQTMKANGLLARCIQHEIDHLNGIICIHR
jgi:peptide deformylase